MILALYIWLALIVLGIIIEAASPQLVSIWFVVGFLGALVANLFGAPLWVQILTASVLTLISLFATKPLVRKIMSQKAEHTNADRNIGKIAVVTDEIDNVKALGRVQIMGQNWAAHSVDGNIIPVGKKVVVKSIEGVKLYVNQEED